MSKILCLFSNPAGTDHLRLDREHKAIQNVINELRVPESCVCRLHAATITDIARAVEKDTTLHTLIDAVAHKVLR